MSHEHLRRELPFVVAMICSVKTEEFKKKWQNMKNLIESKILTDNQIQTIELNIRKAKELREQFQKSLKAASTAPNNNKNDASPSIASKSSPEKPQEAENKSKVDLIKLKQQKELKRLHENIVKDDVPLPSKRRSALKRSYRDSFEYIYDNQDKKRKSESSNDSSSRKSESDFKDSDLKVTPNPYQKSQGNVKNQNVPLVVKKKQEIFDSSQLTQASADGRNDSKLTAQSPRKSSGNTSKSSQDDDLKFPLDKTKWSQISIKNEQELLEVGPELSPNEANSSAKKSQSMEKSAQIISKIQNPEKFIKILPKASELSGKSSLVTTLSTQIPTNLRVEKFIRKVAENPTSSPIKNSLQISTNSGQKLSLSSLKSFKHPSQGQHLTKFINNAGKSAELQSKSAESSLHSTNSFQIQQKIAQPPLKLIKPTPAVEPPKIDLKKSSLDKLKKKIQKQQILKKKNRATLLTKGASIKNDSIKVEDDEWEDVDEVLDSDEEWEPKSNVKIGEHTLEVVVRRREPTWIQGPLALSRGEPIGPSSLEPETTQVQSTSINRETNNNVQVQPQVVVKKVQNISYIPCRSGFIFKCLVSPCKFQTMDNTTFVDHIENEHLTVKWLGQCDVCNDKVNTTRSIIFELMHMRENHVLKEAVDHSKLPDINEHQEKVEAVNIVGKKIDIGKIKLKPLSALVAAPPQRAQLSMKTDGNESFSDVSGSPLSVSNASSSSLDQLSKIEVYSTDKSKETPAVLNKQVLLDKVATPAAGRIIKHIIVKPSKVDQPNHLIIAPRSNIEYRSADSTQVISVHPQPAPTQIVYKEVIDEADGAGRAADGVSRPTDGAGRAAVGVSRPTDGAGRAADGVSGPTDGAGPSTDGSLSIQTQKPAENQKDQTTQDLLRPWIKRKVKKYLMPTTRLLNNVVALASTYKCMSSKCSFYTSDKHLFHAHLKSHETYLPDKDYMNCPYCDHVFAVFDMKYMIDHIDLMHGYDKFQCRYCFYRSCVSLNVINHQRIYHPMKPKSVYELPNEKVRNYEKELIMIKRSRFKYVPPLICVKCSAKFYLFSHLATHMQAHGTNFKTKCTKCGEVSDMNNIHTHFLNCHKLGLYQCVFCIYGTNNFDTIVDHVGSHHASMPPIYCERSSEKTSEINPSSIECTSLKFLTQQVDHRIIEELKLSPEALRNEKNVDDLGVGIKVVVTPRITGKINRALSSIQNHPSSSKNQARNSQVDDEDSISPHIIQKGADGTSEIVSGTVALQPGCSRNILPKPPGGIKTVADVRPSNAEKRVGLQIQNVFSLNSN